MNQRRDLSDDDLARLTSASKAADDARETYQRLVVEFSKTRGFNAVHRAGVPKKSIQDWTAKYADD